ncbi:MAG: single-stranded-DNA-specific exonuclease RecJ [Candidatus Gracilibacteria bacterium]|nr:single-stranded-DNA-specific exonuclease RecJ [Candidatus Gracilibacteria bacterium]
MQEKLSLKGNIIKYDKNTLNKSIEEVIDARFENGEFMLESSIDDLHDPYLLIDMDKAVARIKTAKEKGERIIVFGDYDVDGVTSTSILMHFFKKMGMQASYRIPHRVKDGYGMKTYFMDELAQLGVNLVITVDCGTRDIEVVKYAKTLGIDIIITDHHAVPDIIPEEAIAVINPKRPDCNYLYKNLAGAGVAFKLMQALAYEYMTKEEARAYIIESIDIAAIGTVADCMRLTGENRIIVMEGLKQIKKTRSLGIRKLIEDKIHDDLDGDLFGFLIGPRINAAGRMDSAYKAVNLILNNTDSVFQTISEIEKLNEQRKFLTKEFSNDAINKVSKTDNLLFYISPAIEHGIIGIVAGRVTEQFYKPCICLKDEGDTLVASCRSPEYHSIIETLDKYKDYFLRYGGHKQAAGFSISKEKFGEFKTKIINELNKKDFSHYKKELKIDKVVRLEELGFSFLSKVNRYKPFGIGNEKPLFLVENLEIEKMDFIGKGRDHLRFTTKHGFKIFAFYMGDFFEEIKRSKKNVSLVFDLSEDSWNGNKNLMLKVVDIILEN